MTNEPKTVIRIFEKDAGKLRKIFGQPQWDAFRKALAVAQCTHPEVERRYTTAFVSTDLENAIITDLNKTRTISGYHCGACGIYVFPDQEEE